mmetsp:Transcript_31322/g.83319  ORF Transcript_31322/g.83319 Transcript_31322/m.83319 type:complete len:244 (+) Transcript_31322:1534-2265(+)
MNVPTSAEMLLRMPADTSMITRLVTVMSLLSRVISSPVLLWSKNAISRRNSAFMSSCRSLYAVRSMAVSIRKSRQKVAMPPSSTSPPQPAAWFMMKSRPPEPRSPKRSTSLPRRIGYVMLTADEAHKLAKASFKRVCSGLRTLQSAAREAVCAASGDHGSQDLTTSCFFLVEQQRTEPLAIATQPIGRASAQRLARTICGRSVGVPRRARSFLPGAHGKVILERTWIVATQPAMGTPITPETK